MAPAFLKAATLALRAVSTICPAQPTCPQDDGCSRYELDGTTVPFICEASPIVPQNATISARADSTVCPALPTCPQDNKCSYSANGVSFQVSCSTDFYGGDFGLAQTSTLAGCMNACSASSTCVAASYTSGNCYMKSTLNDASANDNVIGVAVTARETVSTMPGGASQTCPASFTCPENDGCSYTSGSRTLKLTCGVDFYGGDISSVYSGSLESCTESCAANSDCVAASFVGGKGSGHCYMKGTKNAASYNDNVHVVHVVAAPTPTPTPSEVATPSATPSATPIPTPTYVATCDSVNRGANLLENPSFETTTGPWQLSGNAYYWNYQPAAHCGNNYMIFGPYAGGNTVTVSQKSSNQLDTNLSYKVNFNVAPRNTNGPASCKLSLFANTAVIWSKPVTNFSFGGSPYESYMASFTPTSSDVTIRFEFSCVSQGADWQSSYIFLDDVTMARA